MSEENKQVNKTFLSSWGASIPADIAGGAIGSRLGQGYNGFHAKIPFKAKPMHFTGGELGTIAGATVTSGLAEYAAIKHSLHGKVKEQ